MMPLMSAQMCRRARYLQRTSVGDKKDLLSETKYTLAIIFAFALEAMSA
jgi:hypothetical protein